MSIHFEEWEGHDDLSDIVLCIFSYTIRSIISLWYCRVYYFFPFTFPYLFRKEGSWSHGNIWKILFEDIRGTSRTLCFTSRDELIASLARFPEYVSWNRKYIPSMFECEICRDECPTFDSCLRYDDPIRESCDHFVSYREHIWFCLCSYRKYRHQGSSFFQDGIKEFGILHWIVYIYWTSENRNCISVILKRDIMTDRIDTIGTSTDDATSSRYELRDYIFEYLLPVLCILSRSDYTKYLSLFSECSAYIQEIRRLFYGSELLRIHSWVYRYELYLLFFYYFFDSFCINFSELLEYFIFSLISNPWEFSIFSSYESFIYFLIVFMSFKYFFEVFVSKPSTV